MSQGAAQQPLRVPDPPVWRAGDGDLEILFVGRGAPHERGRALAQLEARELSVAWLRQVHSAAVLEAASGCCGEGDALVTARRGLALAVATADCVPIVVGSERGLAAIHAGWRGIARGIVAAAVERLDRRERLAAWIGPAIGPCCYEVDWPVAEQVAAAAAPAEVIRAAAAGKPHLDLRTAVLAQLAAAGVERTTVVAECTRCSPLLWSYRRDGRGAGRNHTFAWLAC